jgi:hypothetical protein
MGGSMPQNVDHLLEVDDAYIDDDDWIGLLIKRSRWGGKGSHQYAVEKHSGYMYTQDTLPKGFEVPVAQRMEDGG